MLDTIEGRWMLVRTHTEVDALHSWPRATRHRAYLAYPHAHRFRITVEARVGHSDREIEFADLRQRLEQVIDEMGSINDQYRMRDWGERSCESVGLHVLYHMPEVDEVTVSEDGRDEARVGRRRRIRPQIVTICGSTRFKDAFLEAARTLTTEGHMALSVGYFQQADGIELSESFKGMLDELHLRKIDASDFIYVVNVGGYIGESTRREIDYAVSLGKPVVYLEPV